MKVKFFTLITALIISSSAFAENLPLETVVVSGGSNLYLTYLSIGVIADAHTKEVYKREQTVLFINSVIAHAKIQKDYLEKLMKYKGISSEDEVFLKKMVDCYVILADEGKSYVEYVNTGSDASLKTYDEKRLQAWAVISGILGFKK